MLAPTFSLRSLLILVTGFALAALVASYAVQGNRWAAAVTIGVASLAVTLLIHGTLFSLVWIFSCFAPRMTQPAEPAAERHGGAVRAPWSLRRKRTGAATRAPEQESRT